jgi:hypothetical protein
MVIVNNKEREMNKRIQELAEQAGLKYHNWITNESNVKDGDFKYPRLEDLEKFAELIIRESMDLLEDFTTDIYLGGIEYVVVGASETLQEHFGIEE